MTVRTTWHDTAQLFGSLLTHQRAHRLPALAIRNRERQAAPSVALKGCNGGLVRPVPDCK